MPAKIVVIANQKGGCGKTTIAMQVGGTLGRAGNRVLIVDADPQGTATRWAASAADESSFPAHVAGLAAAGGKVHREIKKYLDSYDYILVDCPPAVDSPVPQSALLIADVALVPIIPSPADLWAATGTRGLIERAGDINTALQARMVVNMLQSNTSMSKEVLEVLEDFGIPLTLAKLHLRTAYRQAAVFGGTVHDLGREAAKAVQEVEALAHEILSLFKNN
ncbi:ParA family protein [Candidatus Competibacter phosphatis]|jgi:chromosome partitioning protein|uniref:ParA family protein n=1 Tax=Candidatus Competibacter phosphatis TaxID=221280 RepID=A0ABX1TNY6_9GAMM|nr:ParA family partition ATPase [Candidatus Competibacter phosphatis]NMQ21148.1 ParA family protein [Candidatus Competibacter phosphatis]